MSVLNENEVKLYIQEKYISNTLSNENIFTDKTILIKMISINRYGLKLIMVDLYGQQHKKIL